MSKFGRCCICTISFNIHNVCSLRCGHTFHKKCNSKTCPQCRKKTILRDVVNLYFDEADTSFSQIFDDEDENKTIEDLKEKLNVEKENLNKILVNFTDCQEEIKLLKAQLEQEKKKTSTLKLKDEKIRSLEKLLQDQTEMEREINVWKARVKASDFFALLTAKDENISELKIDKFLTSSKDIDYEQFFLIMRKQLLKMQKHLETRGKDLKEAVTNFKKTNTELNLKIKKYEKTIANLRRENEILKNESKKSPNNLDFNKTANDTLKSKKSLGFSFEEEICLDSKKRFSDINKSKEALNMFINDSDEDDSFRLLIRGEKNISLKSQHQILSDEENQISVPCILNNKTKKSVIVTKRKLSSQKTNLIQPNVINKTYENTQNLPIFTDNINPSFSEIPNFIEKKTNNGIKRYLSNFDEKRNATSNLFNLKSSSSFSNKKNETITIDNFLDNSTESDLSPVISLKNKKKSKFSLQNSNIEIIELD